MEKIYKNKNFTVVNDCNHAVLIWDGKSKGTQLNEVDLGKLRKRITMFDLTID